MRHGVGFIDSGWVFFSYILNRACFKEANENFPEVKQKPPPHKLSQKTQKRAKGAESKSKPLNDQT